MIIRYEKSCQKYGIYKYTNKNGYWHYSQILVEDIKSGKTFTYTKYKGVAERWLKNIKHGLFREFSYKNYKNKM